MALTKPKYTITIYDDYATIEGNHIQIEALNAFMKLGKIHGFTHLIPNTSGSGFRLVTLNEN